MKAMNMPPEVIHEFKQLLAEPDALTDAGAHPHLQAVIADMHMETWFTIQGVEDVAHTMRGTKPGDTLGIFCSIF